MLKYPPGGAGMLLSPRTSIAGLVSEYAALSPLASWEWDKGAQTLGRLGDTVITYLPDVSGNGHHMLQPNLLLAPLYDATNGLVFRLGEFLRLLPANPFLSGVAGYTVLFNGTANAGAANKRIFSMSRVGGTTPALGRFSIAGTSSNRPRFQGLPNATSGTDSSALGTAAPTLATYVKLCWTVEITNATTVTVNFYTNGAANGSIVLTVASGGTVTPTGSPNVIVMGGDCAIQTDGGVLEPMTFTDVSRAYLRKLHVFPRVLTAGEVATL